MPAICLNNPIQISFSFSFSSFRSLVLAIFLESERLRWRQQVIVTETGKVDLGWDWAERISSVFP